MMQFLSNQLYMAMNAALFIAQNGSARNPLSGASIVEHCGLNNRALEPVLQKLARAGVIVSIKGVGGGYYIGRPQDVSLGDIARCFVKSVTPPDPKLKNLDLNLKERLEESYADWLEKLSDISLENILYRDPVLDFVV